MCMRFEDFIRITYHWGVQSDRLSGLKSWYAYLHLAVHKRRPRADCDVREMIAGTFHAWHPGWNDLVTRIWSLQIQWYSNERSEFCQGIRAHYRDSVDTRALLYMRYHSVFRSSRRGLDTRKHDRRPMGWRAVFAAGACLGRNQWQPEIRLRSQASAYQTNHFQFHFS